MAAGAQCRSNVTQWSRARISALDVVTKVTLIIGGTGAHLHPDWSTELPQLHLASVGTITDPGFSERKAPEHSSSDVPVTLREKCFSSRPSPAAGVFSPRAWTCLFCVNSSQTVLLTCLQANASFLQSYKGSHRNVNDRRAGGREGER